MFGMFFDVRNYAENATRLEYFHSFLFLGTTVSLGWVIVPKVFIFTSTVIFPISYVPKVNLNQKY